MALARISTATICTTLIASLAFGAANSAFADSEDSGPFGIGSTLKDLPHSPSWWVRNEMDYTFSWWNQDKEGSEGHNDAYAHLAADTVNFVSQALVARNWRLCAETQQDRLDPKELGVCLTKPASQAWYSWKTPSATGDFSLSKSFVSATNLHNYIAAHPNLGKQLDDHQRASVKIGDIVEFDWGQGKTSESADDAALAEAADKNLLNNSDPSDPTAATPIGVNRDFTGIVTGVKFDEQTGEMQILFAYHKHGQSSSELGTKDHFSYSVDDALKIGGDKARAYYWSLN